MSKKLTVMFAPVDGVGHVNACIGVAENLKERGHKIVFVVGKPYKGKLIKYGFEEEILENVQDNVKTTINPGEFAANELLQSGLLSSKSPIEKQRIMSENMNLFESFVLKTIKNEPLLKTIIARHNPDVFLIDNIVGSPSLIYSNKPWVLINSLNPLYILKHENLPPPFLGLSINSDKSEWTDRRELIDNLFAKESVVYNDWLTKQGYPAIPNKKCIPELPYLNLYLYREVLDYTDIRQIPDNYFRIDAAVRKGEEEFKLPEELRKSMKSSDKLIYLSLGSMGSIDVELMKRLVQMLSKSEHKFIVSKDLNADKYELGANMRGERSVPQTRVLPLVDLVLTHGGNNTVSEIFRFGKPMIVMPLTTDQFDNAQRVADKGFGVQLDPYNCTEEELLESIDRLLNDRELKERLSVASHKIQNSNTLTKASELIESLVK